MSKAQAHNQISLAEPRGDKSPVKVGRRKAGFRPVNTLSSPQKPTFYGRDTNLDLDDKSGTDSDVNDSSGPFAMVKDRDPSCASSGRYFSPPKTERQPLANISAKMQAPSPKSPPSQDDDEDFASLKPVAAPEFGKASPLRNPLKKQSPSSNLFIPKKPVFRPAPSMYMSSAAQQAQHQSLQPRERPRFYLPGEKRQEAQSAPDVSRPQPGYVNPPYRIPQPVNSLPTSTIPTRPQFSSVGPSTYYQAYQPQKPAVDLAKDDDDEDGFDPDAAVRADSGEFGDVDPYAYIDSTQANENIKNLLEGAFDDDDDKPRTRLRKRAKKAAEAGNEKAANSLADKLAGLEVKDEGEAAAKVAGIEDEEEEDGTVEGLAVKLLPHQVEGVAWMINKEIGKGKKSGVLPKGGILADDMGLGKTVQSVALMLTNTRPPLDAKPEFPKQKLPGKEVSKSTLVVAPLALIKQWEDEIKTKVSRSHAMRVLIHHGPNRTKSAAELKKYDVVITTYQTLTSEHGASQMHIAGGTRIGCMGVHWYRVMLDEAHSIKNRNAKSTQACYALESWYRWCLTGTPMQNNLDELQSLIRFLRIKPYHEQQKWKSDITQPMKNGRGGLAMKRLRVFLQAFMKRRTKDILKQSGALSFSGKINADESNGKSQGMRIVKREVLTIECSFDEAEQEFYDRLQSRADKRLQEMMKAGQKADYIGALVLLLRLRQACNHPHLIELAMSKDKETVNAQMQGQKMEDKYSSQDDGMDDLTRLMGGVSVENRKCDICQCKLSPAEAKDGGAHCAECEEHLQAVGAAKPANKGKKIKRVQTSRKKHHQLPDDSDDEGEGEWIGEGPAKHIDLGVAGGTDDEDAEGGGESLDSIDSERSASDDENEEDSPPRAHRRNPIVKQDYGDEGEESGSDADSSSGNLRLTDERKPSTKIRRLLRILHTESREHKTIVFSQFTTMLDLVEPHLATAGIRYVRYDGGMRNDAREASLHSLRNDKNIRVLLCSLKCGSLGLNLTAASRVVIVEPFWNPFVEEQAIDRVHRLNQTVDVKVYRLTISNSVEERILALQERKRELAKAAIEGAGNSLGKLSMQEILGLFKHDAAASHAEHDETDREMWEKFGNAAGLLDGSSRANTSAGNDVTVIGAGQGASRVVKGTQPARKEHDVFGRRW